MGDETYNPNPYPPPTKSELIAAVKELRRKLGDTQPQFAARIGASIRTVTHWEKNRPPHGRVLFGMHRAAEAANDPALSSLFTNAIFHEIEDPPYPESVRQAMLDITHPERRSPISTIKPDLATALNELARDLKEQTRAREANRKEVLNLFSRFSGDMVPLLVALENPGRYADELTAWRIIRRDIDRKLAESKPKASSES